MNLWNTSVLRNSFNKIKSLFTTKGIYNNLLMNLEWQMYFLFFMNILTDCEFAMVRFKL